MDLLQVLHVRELLAEVPQAPVPGLLACGEGGEGMPGDDGVER